VRAGRWRTDVLGEGLTALCGGALAFNLLLVAALLGVLVVNGMGHFWQDDLWLVELGDGSRLLGEITDREEMPGEDAASRVQVKTGNRDVTGRDFVWVPEAEIASRFRPGDAVLLERLEYGNFYGTMIALRRGNDVLATGIDETWDAFGKLHGRKLDEREALHDLERGELTRINRDIEALRLERRELAIPELPAGTRIGRESEIDARVTELQARYEELAETLFAARRELVAETVVMETASGTVREVPVSGIVRAVRPNGMGVPAKLVLYGSRLVEFLTDDPRESNTEGGIFPAIFGTVMMVFLMTIAVTPLGVLAALYLREYAKQGPLVRIVRIAVNNLAGVPSIVFGVFGLGFFVYFVGGSIDRLFFPASLPTPTYGTGGVLWASLTLALLTVPVVIVATEEGLAAVPRIVREGSLALGATKFETTWRVVLPAAAPGMLTGLILAMARAAGEVAPLMIVGVVKLAPDLPLDGDFPFLHLERKFMHLGFHIYDVGFQSPNVEAAKPLVFATALLLIVVVTVMNLTAIAVRNHLRKKYAGSAV
jgi:phosphate transport system permease protein